MSDEGLTHEEFMALSGLAPLPVQPSSSARLPALYTKAVQAIAACQTIDEALEWNTRAEALAAWARIYSEDAVSIEARRLKLHAYRRMGLLANDAPVQRAGYHAGRPPGPRKALIVAGLTSSKAAHAIAVAAVPLKRFDKLVAAEKPLSPETVMRIERGSTRAYLTVYHAISRMRNAARNQTPSVLAQGMSDVEREKLSQDLDIIAGWISAMRTALQGRRAA